MLKIAVDAMGGDRAPGAVVEGALLAAGDLGVEVLLVGEKEMVEQALARCSPKSPRLEVVPASESVAMDESPSAALRKKDSSMKVAFELMKRGAVQAVVSAGNSGAMMATGMFVMGNLPQVDRPAILVVIPTLGKGTVIIDAGANVDCKPRHLVQFGLMGSIYAERVLGIPRPRVGVLSNGEEEGKGTDLTRAASEQLASTGLNYIGYVEGRDICGGEVDVVVCDGFTGNITLKTMEGLASFIVGVLKDAFQQSLMSRLGYLLSRESLLRAYSRLDHAEYGGAPLMGLEGVAIIAHGGSDPKAIKNAIRVAKEAVSHDVNRHITEVLGELGETGAEQEDKLPRRIWQRIKSKIESLGEKSAPEGEGRESKSGGKG
ncbi:MAG: phosphate acyltransferase PlsX [Deltaproteobacteria bacterium]|nr:phosphate acyltransferase PlsX [Deltaproteobacteria bacterium]